MQINYNGQSLAIEKSMNLADFLEFRMKIKGRYFAVVLNNVLIHRQKYQSIVLKNGDSVELLQATVGG